MALFEFKSQVGSFGNNGNNRAEALGNALDVLTAANKGLIPIKPWLGFVFVLEDGSASRGVGTGRTKTFYPKDTVFEAVSYVDRYRLLAERSVEEGLYQAAWVAITTRPEIGFGWDNSHVGTGYEQFREKVRAFTARFGWSEPR